MRLSHNIQTRLTALIWLVASSCHPQFRDQQLTQFQTTEPNSGEQQVHRDQLTEKKKLLRQHQDNRIEVVNDQTFNIAANTSHVWNAAINVLMKNYNLNILDQVNGVITTEWDSFYLDGKILRNKISLRITPLPFNKSQITILNNMEAAISDSGPDGTLVPWVPSEDLAGEAARVISSIASTLKIPPPDFPEKMAKYYKDPKSGIQAKRTI